MLPRSQTWLAGSGLPCASARTAAGHLAFAAGPHFRLGPPLARLEATIAVRALASRVTGPELDPAGLAYRPNLNLRGPERLVAASAEIRADGA